MRQRPTLLEAGEGFRVDVGGRTFVDLETTVNQMVKDDMFLSSHLEWPSPSAVRTQKGDLHTCTWDSPENRCPVCT